MKKVAYPKLREEKNHQVFAKQLVENFKVLKAMDTKLVVITFVLVLTLTAATGEFCGMSVADLYSCKPYVQTKNPLTTAIDPKGPCCTALSGADFQCLCNQKSKANPFLSGIDLDLASKLPEMCGLSGAVC